MSHTAQHPGAIDINGAQYMKNGRGDLTPIANIKPADLLQDDMVRKLCAYAEDLSSELARFQFHSHADIAGFDALLDQEYGVRNERSTKGNRTFSSFDGSLKVKISVADQISFGPELQSAKKLLDEMIIEQAEGAPPFLVALVTQAFKTDKEGKIDTGSILALRRLEVDDPRWENITRAIDDSIKVFGSKSYLRFYKQDEAGSTSMIPLDMASVAPRPTDMARQSLRRRVESLDALVGDLKIAFADVAELLDRGDVDAAKALVLRAHGILA